MKVERRDKIHVTGVPGLLFNKSRSGYKFQILCPGKRTKTVYIGTENTWQSNYSSALAKAKDLMELMRTL